MTSWFERLIGIFFIIMLILLVLFFTYVPLVQESKNVIMLIMGVLIATAKDAIPRMFGNNKDMQERVNQLEAQVELLMNENKTIKDEYDKILKRLVDNYTDSHPVDKGDVNV